MIRGHIALIRLLRAYMEGSLLPWGEVTFKNDHDDDGRVLYDAHRAEIAFTHRGTPVEVVIIAPSDERIEGAESLPLGRLAARIANDHVVKGPIDQTTWDRIVHAIHCETVAC